MTVSLRERLRRQFQTTGELRPMATDETPTPETDAALQPMFTSGTDVVSPPLPPPARLARGNSMTGPPADAPLSTVDQLKVDLHRRLVERLDMEALEAIKDERQLAGQIRDAVTMFLAEQQAALSQAERDDIIEQIVYEVTGLGPLEPLFRDPSISDILVNGPRDVYVERRGRLSRVSTTFRNDAHLLAVIDRIVSRVGRRVDESSPMVDARLPDGSRVNAIIPPLAIDGPVLSIRRFGSGLSMEQLIAHGALNKSMAMFLAACVRAKINILISGGTGSGKTTLLNALSSFIPANERVITVEDAAELQLQQEHVVRLETRPPNVEGRGEVAARDLIRNALRMRPNRIIVGEVRSAEVIDMLQAMNTGHEGSLATIHANSARDALARLETMALMAGTNLPLRAMREQIASAIDLIVQVGRMSDGTRRVLSITEISNMKEEVIATSEVFTFQRHGVQDGKVLGTFRPSGIRPSVVDRLELAGMPLPVSLFDDTLEPEELTVPVHSGPAPVDAEWAELSGSLASFDANTAQALQQASVVQDLEEALRRERERVDHLQDQVEIGRVIADALRRELADQQATAAAAVDAAARANAELEVLQQQVEELRRPRAARAETLLTFVDTADYIIQRSGGLADDEYQRGIALLSKRLTTLLDTIGFESTAAPGLPVDDTVHDVVARVPHPELPPGTIAQVVRRGFRVGGELLRRAEVVAAEAA